jgi:hypothetical protein
MKAWLAIALQESVYRRALKVMLVVGSILALINHGEALLVGTVTLKAWIQIGLTFLVPYCVSTYASVQAIRQLTAGGALDSAPKRQ